MNSSRKYKPGFRSGSRKYGQIHKDLAAWVETHYGRISLLLYPWNEANELATINVGPTVDLVFPPGKPHMLLTHLTTDELENIRTIFNMAIDFALPVAAERDRIADAGTREGDDTYYRAYRAAPTMVIREGPITEYHKGILFGSDGVSGSDGNADSNGNGVRESGTVVATDESPEEQSSDDTTQVDEP